VKCKYCSGTDLKRDGHTSTGSQSYLCRGCGRKSLANGRVHKGRFDLEVIRFAQRQRIEGMTYRDIAALILKQFGVKTSDVTVIHWCTEPQFKLDCIHYWIISPASGGETSSGVCKFCGTQKAFNNYFKKEFYTTTQAHREKQKALDLDPV